MSEEEEAFWDNWNPKKRLSIPEEDYGEGDPIEGLIEVID
jgi:hypothetical protein